MTFFLDEVGDMPVSMQVKLLMVLEGKEIERVGDNTSTPVDIRLITATNRELSGLIEAGHFREDLLYRINVIPIRVPPLRGRMEDLPALVSHYLRKISMINGRDIQRLSFEAMDVLERFSWPGNIRQLINALEYAAITCRGDAIEFGDLPDYLCEKGPVAEYTAVNTVDGPVIREALEKYGGNRTRAARHLGISRVTLWKRLKEMEAGRNA